VRCWDIEKLELVQIIFGKLYGTPGGSWKPDWLPWNAARSTSGSVAFDGR
jgi:hypothetical protein